MIRAGLKTKLKAPFKLNASNKNTYGVVRNLKEKSPHTKKENEENRTFDRYFFFLFFFCTSDKNTHNNVDIFVA